MIHGTEYVLSQDPFIVRRVVRWGDCDPAGVVFTGRFTDYLLGAVALYTEHLAQGASSLGAAHGVDTPCRGMSLSFEGTLWPRDEIDIHCTIGSVRTRSYDVRCVAVRTDGRPVFTATFSPICVRSDARVGTDIPPSLRAILEAHQRTPASPDMPARA